MALTNTYNWNHNFPKLAHDTGFSFNTHKPRVVIDWNKIKLIDIEQLIRNRDFATVEDHFHDVVDCGLEWEFDVRILDSGVVKLFRLAQLAVEYQLYCRQYLDRSVAVLRDELSNTMQDLDKLKKELRTKEEEIKKLRKRSKGHKTMIPYVYGNENIANMILKTLSHGPDIMGPKPYSDEQQGYNKCSYCDKVFLNETYLKSHILRRHPEHANDIQQQMSPIGVEKSSENINQSNERLNTKLYDEINELKQRLKDTERLLSGNSGTVNNNHINSNQDNSTNSITKNNTSENIPHSPNTGHNEAQIGTTESTPVDPNTVLEKKLEEWKMNEQKRYIVEIESLKKQLSENFSALREKTIDSPVVSRDDQALQYLTATLQKQEDEIKSLHRQLESKNAAVETTELQLKSQIESQEQTWRDKLSILEDKHASQVDQLTQRLEEVHRESVNVQQQRKSETTELDDLRRRMEERIAALERGKGMREVATALSPGKKLLPKSDSIDSLPPYTSSILPTTKCTLQSTHNHLRRQAQRVLSKQLHSETTTLSESSDESLELDKTPIKMCRPVKSNNSNIKNNEKNKETSKKTKKGNKENILRHQKWDKNEVSPVRKDITQQSKSKDKIIPKIHKSKENITRNVKSLPTTPEKSEIITRKNINEKIGLSERGGVERRSKSEMDLKRLRERKRRCEGSDLSECEITNNLHRRRVSFDDMGYTSEQRQKRAEIRKKVLSRLQTLGVDPKCRGLTKRELNAHQTTLQHSRSTQGKKNNKYAKTRSNILHMIDKEIRKKTGKLNEDLKDKMKESPTAKLVNRLSVVSMFSNVKNKAMSIVKTHSDKIKIDRNHSSESVSERNASLPNTPSGSQTSSPLKKVLNKFSPKRKSHETIDTKRKILANSTSRKIVDESDENLSEEEISDSKSLSSSVEKMTHLFNGNKKTVSGGYKVVTAAIAHEPSKSIESLIRSPIKVPLGKLNNVAMSNKGQSLLRATSVQSLEFDSSRNAWSTRSEETETRVLESDSDDSESVMKARKFFSEENLIHSVSSPKGVLKNAPSNLSISSKKKVLFDLEATQMKSVSASPSQSTAEVNRFGSSERMLDADSENHWDVSSIDDIPIKEPSKAPAEMLKRSPKIAELTQRIEQQLARRPENIQMAGAVQVMPKSDHKSPEKGVEDYGIGKSNEYVENYRDMGGNGLRTTNVLMSGSNTSIGSSMLDDSNDLMNSPVTVPVPAPRYSANRGMSGNVNKESDFEISDWSIEELLKAK